MKKILTLLSAVIIFAAFNVVAAQDSSDRNSGKNGGKVWKKDSVWVVVSGDSVRAVVETAVDALADSAELAEIHEGPFLDFGQKTEVDFGRIKEKGGKQVREFIFKNSGDKPLVITKTMVSCRCMDVSCVKKPILPGGEGKITVTYNPRKQSGVFYKAIQVYSNDPQTRRIIFVKGEVVE